MVRPRVALLTPALFVAAIVVASGCTTSITTLQGARTLDPGQVQVEAATAVPVPTALISSVLDSAGTLEKRFETAESANEEISEEEHRQALETGLAALAFTPGVMTELVARYGVREDLDVGLRYSGSLFKGDAKYRILRNDDGPELALNLGYAYHLGFGASVASAAYGVLDFVKLSDYSRHDVDLGLIAGRRWGEWLELYVATRYVVSLISVDGDIEKVSTATNVEESDLSATMHHFGGSAGLMIGYRYVYLNLELAVAKVLFEPKILGETRDLGGWIVTPVAGLVGRF